MIRRCKDCPNHFVGLQRVLKESLQGCDEGSTIHFSQWITSDRSTMVIQQEFVEDYIDLIVRNSEKPITHSNTAKAQARYLKEEHTALFLGDFAENYRFITQDEVQGFHWNDSQCTYYHAVIYYTEDGSLIRRSYCIKSGDNDHDVAFDHLVHKAVITDLICRILRVKTIECLGMAVLLNTKIRTTFLTFVYTRISKLVQKWNFFATSHGKQPCDGIVGTVKRLVKKASQQRDTTNQILNAQSMFELCRDKIINI